MNRIFLAIFLLFSAPCFISAQGTNNIDSLISVFELSGSDAERWSTLNQINNFVGSTVSKDSVIEVWDRMIQVCQNVDYENGAYYCKYNKAKELRLKGDFNESQNLLNMALSHFESQNITALIAKIHNSLGIFYYNVEDYDLARTHYMQSIELQSLLTDTLPLAWYYLNMGSLEENCKNYEDAIKYLQKSEPILKKKDPKNLVNCYINFGDVYVAMKNADSAYFYLLKAYQLAKKNEVVEEKFHSAFHLGLFLFNQSQITEAEPYLLEAENLNTNYVIGDFLIDDQIQFYDVERKYYDLKNNFEKAYKFAVLKQKTEDQNKRVQFNTERFRKESENKVQREEAKRKNRDLAIFLILIVLLASIFIIIFIYRSYKHKQKANRLLTEMDELKSQLFSDISHELRTPLTLILAPLEQMLSKEAEKKPSRKQIKLMRKNANAILNLVNQILDLSKIDAKSMKLELSESNIVSFIRAHFAAFSSLAGQKNISLNSYTPPDKKVRFFDAGKLEKIINNLLSNALKFTPEGGQIFCFANFPKDNQLELVIQDTGKGIPENELPKIFDRFHQVKESNTNHNLGTGIGLSLTKELVELMYGQISVESIVSEGTKFKVSLPLGKDHLKEGEYILLTNPVSTNNISLNELDDEQANCTEIPVADTENLPEILVVEDHTEISEFIKDNLQNCYKVYVAPNGKIGLEKATELIPDLIISDVMMPEMNGFEMSKKLKADIRTSHIPIILLTAKASQKDKMEGLETGIDAFLPKPFNMNELSLRVRKLIEQRQKLRERFTRNLKLEPKDIAVTSADEKFLDQMMELIEKNMSNSEFEMSLIQEELFMSRTQLFRKIKALTNQSPGEFIRTVRLKRAAQLIESGYGNIAQITYEVGFNNPSYFAKCFKELYGVLPSEYSKNQKK